MENPWKQHSGIHPELENGHRRIETTILRALISHGLRGSEWDVTMAVIDKTYGHRKTWDFISYGQLAKVLRTNRKTTKRVAESLELQRILIIDRSAGPRKIHRIMFNKYHDTWLKNYGSLKRPSVDQLRGHSPPDIEELTGHSPPDDQVELTGHSPPDTNNLGSHNPPDGKNNLRGHSPPPDRPWPPRTEGPGPPHNIKKKLLQYKLSRPNSDLEAELSEHEKQVVALGRRLRRKILEWKLDWNPPTDSAFQRWLTAIDRMIRIDNRSPPRIARVIDFATSDTFWQPNIMSGDKLREKFDTLEGQMRRSRAKKSSGLTKHEREMAALGKYINEEEE